MGKWGWVLALAAVGGAGYWLYKRSQNATLIPGMPTKPAELEAYWTQLQRQIYSWQDYVDAGPTNAMYSDAVSMIAQLRGQQAIIDEQLKRIA